MLKKLRSQKKKESLLSEIKDHTSSANWFQSSYSENANQHNPLPSTSKGEALFNKHKNRVSHMKSQQEPDLIGDFMGKLFNINNSRVPESQKMPPKRVLKGIQSSKVAQKASLLSKLQISSREMAKNTSKRQWAHMNTDHKNCGSVPKPEKPKRPSLKKNKNKTKKAEKVRRSAVVPKPVISNETFNLALEQPSVDVASLSQKRKRERPSKNSFQVLAQEDIPIKKRGRPTKNPTNEKPLKKTKKNKKKEEAVKVKAKYKRVIPLNMSDSEESDMELPNLSKYSEPCNLSTTSKTISTPRPSTNSSNGSRKNVQNPDVNLSPCRNELAQHMDYSNEELDSSTSIFSTNEVPYIRKVSQVANDTVPSVGSPSSKENIPGQSIANGETISTTGDKSPTGEIELIVHESDDDDVMILDNDSNNEEDEVFFIERVIKDRPCPEDVLKMLFKNETGAKKSKELADEIKRMLTTSNSLRTKELIRKIDDSNKPSSNIYKKYW